MPDHNAPPNLVDELPPTLMLPMSACTEHLSGLVAGEAPFWDSQSASLWLVDMLAPSLISVCPSSGVVQRWPMPQTIGSFALCESGGAIVALRDGLYRLNLESGALALFARPDPDRTNNRLNDGKASPEGRFWIGSMNEATPRQPEAALYRVDPDGSVFRVLDGLYTSNGLAWSPDGRKMYHSDSRAEILQIFDYDPASGAISNGKLLARLSDRDGRPDGGTVDADGYYWSAGASAGLLNRFSADGRLVARYRTPVAAPSMICFGGKDFSRIFVTSLSVQRAGMSEAGRLISFAAPVLGVPGHRFRDKPQAVARI